jgi:glycosyltransferase involved in cell wall biosynthesis
MHILNSVYGDSTGGRWNATLKTGELLAQRGHRVTLLIAPEDAAKVPDYAGTNIDVVTLRNSGHYDLIASWKARRLIRERKIDAVIAHSGRAIHMLKRAAPAGVPVVAFNHSHNIKRTLKADAFFCITPYMKQIVDAATGGTKPAYVISNAVSVPPDELLVRPENPVFTIGAMARMAPNKGVSDLVEALGLLDREGVAFRAVIAGDGEVRAALGARVAELGLQEKVHFPGWIKADQKQAFYRDADVICFTSESDVQPLVILESFAWGKALIGTDVPGPSSCYTHEDTALVVPSKNPRALADALARLARGPVLRETLGRRARAHAIANYADDVIGVALEKHLRLLIDRASLT